MSKRVAVISAILENPREHQADFNDIVAQFQDMIRGRMGIPFHQGGISVIALTVLGSMDEINALTGKLGRLPHIQVKTSISKVEVEDETI